jgi:ABC-2 type transport system ATP-binding protein
VLTTHYLEEAEALVHRLAVVARGRIVADGEPGALRERYGTEATVAWMEPDGTPHGAHRDTGPDRRGAHATPRRRDPGLTVTRPTPEDVYLRLTGQAEEDAR